MIAGQPQVSGAVVAGVAQTFDMHAGKAAGRQYQGFGTYYLVVMLLHFAAIGHVEGDVVIAGSNTGPQYQLAVQHIVGWICQCKGAAVVVDCERDAAAVGGKAE